jgi:YD repeat-containing protein
MITNDKPSENGVTNADDNVNNNVRYDKDGNLVRIDDRDKKDSTEDWDAELSRTGRHK